MASGAQIRARRGARSGLGPLSLCIAVLTCLTGCGLLGSADHPDPGGVTTHPSTARRSTGSPSTPGTPSEAVPTPRSGAADTRRGVRYAVTSPRQTLDLYLPEGDGSTVFPMVVLIHGGGFFSGDSSEETDRATFLASKGFAAVSLNYRLSGDAPFPAGVQDVKAAIRFVRAHAPGWGVDPHRIAVWGDSAGGYLAAMIGATGGASSAFDDASLGNPHISSTVSAVISWFGPSNFATMDAQAGQAHCDEAAQQHDSADSPESKWLGAALPTIAGKVAEANVVRQVKAAGKLPPYLLVHGELDCTVPPGQSTELYDALKAKGAGATLTLVPGAAHSDPKIVDEQTRPALTFLRSVFGTTRPG